MLPALSKLPGLTTAPPQGFEHVSYNLETCILQLYFEAISYTLIVVKMFYIFSLPK